MRPSTRPANYRATLLPILRGSDAAYGRPEVSVSRSPFPFPFLLCLSSSPPLPLSTLVSLSDNTPMFAKVSTFAIQLLSLPHSSANVERLFSQINLIKTDVRNSILSATLSGLIHTKEYLNSKSCYIRRTI
ncbi:hypothetical protein ALC57_10766 [Trachymyrmex cornetzi]|uniref:HAT C-terminal dimerisation domain-containing protein n=1 Tax=Trachymyrmex cornetzi TaxID=471704 RepID=A0A151J3J3_9HYME|nr:hypothetical protein ALC57_10766 [Trachymyrmex cornetzi]